MEELTIEQENSMDAWMLEELEQEQKDSRILNRVKNWTNYDIFKKILYVLDESENPRNYRITDEPAGGPQNEDEITVWVDICRCSGDSWAGTCCIELPNRKYLMWDFFMGG